MIVVAIRNLGTSIDVEAPLFASACGLAVYEARMKLSQAPPIIALRTADEQIASALAIALRSRKHDVVTCDDGAIPPPVAVRAFRFTPAALECGEDTIAYGDITTLVRATRTLHGETITKITERKLRPGAAILTGGLILSKKVTRDEKVVRHDKEDLLYVVTRSGRAFLFAERGTQYSSLEQIAPTQRENFQRVISTLRERAPHATFDERLLARRNATQDELDLFAHVLALHPIIYR